MGKPLALVSLLACVLLVPACASRNSTLTVRSLSNNRTFSQPFVRTYAAHNSDGSYEFLAVADEMGTAVRAAAKSGEPLQPLNDTPLHQVFYLKLLWLPMHANANEAPLPNASLDWMILNDSPGHEADLLRYQGTGFASVSESSDFIAFKLRDATLKPRTVVGSLSDPLGAMTGWGDLTGLIAPIRLHDILASTRQRAGLPSTP